MYRILLLFILLIFTRWSSAQNSAGLGYFGLPQAVYANPAYSPDARVVVGVPVLSGISFNHENNWLNFEESTAIDGKGRLNLDAQNLLDNIDDFATLRQDAGVELLHAGVKAGDHYFNFRVREHLRIGMRLPKDIFKLAAYGNAGSHQFTNNTANFSGLGVGGVHYREYALGYSYRFNSKLTAGLTARALYGMESVKTEKSSLALHTNPLDYSLHSSGALSINTAGVNGVLDNSSSPVQRNIGKYLTGLNNWGFGFDAGASYTNFKKLTVGISVMDVGFIKWDSDAVNLATRNAEYAFNGIDFTDFLFVTGSDFNQELDDEVDTLLNDLDNNFGFENEPASYKTQLNGYARYAVSWRLFKAAGLQGRVWGTVKHGFAKSNVPLTYSIGYNQSLWKIIQLGLHYSKARKIPGSIGAGVAVKAGPVQVYMLADNFHFATLDKVSVNDGNGNGSESTFYYFHNPDRVRFNIGINLLLGRVDSKGKDTALIR